MALVIWNVRYVLPADRNTNQNLRSNMQYGATREGVQKLVEVEKEPPMSDAEGLNYIANRRGVARLKNDDDTFGDGLFNAGGKADLDKEVSRMESHADSTEWRAIISFTKEDLRRSGYDDPEAFRQLLAAKMPEIGKQYGISHQNLVWNAAFHPVDKKGLDHHPHYHVYFYSTDPSEGVGGTVSVKKTETARSILTNAVFKDDLSHIKTVGREARAQLNAATQKLLENPDWMLLSGFDARLEALADKLPKTGKKVYAFLPHDLKETVDNILRDMVKQPGISEAYEELVANQRRYIEAYNDDPNRIEERLDRWKKHFFHPTGENDRATLHNQLIKMATKIATDRPIDGVLTPIDEDPPTETDVSVEEFTLLTNPGEGIAEESDAKENEAMRRQAHMERLATRMQKGDMDACFWLSRMVRRDNPELADRLMKTAADNGHGGALHEIAKTRTDPREKMDLLERAAATGDPGALYNLGEASEHAGLYDKAFYYYEKAANRSVRASLRLADLYQKKEWLDPEQAEHYRQTARALLRIEDVFLDESFGTMEKATLTEEDYKFARYQLGFAYQESGKISDAFMEYSEAAIKGHLNSMRSVVRIHHHAGWMKLLQEQESAEFISVAHNLSQSLERQLLPCAEFSAEYRTARQLLRKNDPSAVELLLAEAGTKNVLALIDLGQIYEDGKLVKADLDLSKQYYLQARKELESILTAAKKPNGYLEFCLGNLFLKGKGSEPDVESGIRWHKEAMSHGSAMAALTLAGIYERGDVAPKDPASANTYYSEAISLLRRVIEKTEKKEGAEPNPDLEFRIGQLLMDGKGCEKNVEEAKTWFCRALKHGNTHAADRLVKIYLDTEDTRAAVRRIGGVHVLRNTEVAKQSEPIQQLVTRLAKEMSARIPKDLQVDLKEAAEEFVLKKIYHRDVATVATGIYQSAKLRRSEYQELASTIHCADAHSKELPTDTQERINRLLPPVASQADEAARERMEEAVLNIAVGERINLLVKNDPALRNLIVHDTAELRECIRSFGCTKYSSDLPEPIQKQLRSSAERIAEHHVEFKAAYEADPERWQRQVWNVARQQMLSQQYVHRFTRNGISTMLLIAADIGHLSAQLQKQQQQSKDPEKQKRKKGRQSDRSSISENQSFEDDVDRSF